MGKPSLRLRVLLPLFVVAGFALAVCALETALARRYPDALLRNSDRPDEDDMFDRFYQIDWELGRWHKRPFAQEWRGNRYTINAKGLRDAEVPYDNPHDRERILTLGDSVPWGYGVGDGETFSDLLERAWPGTDVINMGVSGYGVGETLLLLRREGLRYGPDLVVLVFCVGNDVEDTYFPDEGETYPANIFYLEDGALRINRIDFSLPRKIGMTLNERSYLVNVLLKKVLTRRQPSDTGAMSAIETINRRRLAATLGDMAAYGTLTYLDIAEPVGDEHFRRRYRLLRPTPQNYYKMELTKRLLEEMAATVRGQGARFVVVLMPYPAQLDPESPYARNPLNRELMRFLRERGIEAVDLLPRLMERGGDPGELFLDGVHLSVRGHEVVAGLLQKVLSVDGVRLKPDPAD